MILTTEKGCLRADLQSLGDLVADGKITDDDAYHLRMMSAFCAEFAPSRLQSIEHANRQIEWLSDPERVQWLGLTADNARDAIAVRETWIAARTRVQAAQ